MRIFYAADTSPNAAFESLLWRQNLYAPLVAMGHEVVEFDYDLRPVFMNLDPSDPAQERFISKTRPRTSRELLRQVRRTHAERPVDLFFSYFYDACVSPETIDEIRSLGIVTVNWYCNASYQLHLVAGIAPHYDWCLVPEKFRLDDYRALGARPIYCQMAANPDVYRPFPIAHEFDVTFVGQAYGERPRYVRRLLDEGIDVRVWGTGWERYATDGKGAPRSSSLHRGWRIGSRLLSAEGWRAGLRRARGLARAADRTGPTAATPSVDLPRSAIGGALPDAEMVRMYSRTRINLGFSTVAETRANGARIVQIRLRDFEVPMSGGFYMVEAMPELEEFYDTRREIVCYADEADLADKIRFYLAHEREREDIRQAGRRRALRDHTWERRFGSAFEAMGLARGVSTS